MKYRIVEQKAFRLVGYKLSTARMENFEQFKEIPKFWDKQYKNGNFDKLMAINLSESHSDGRVDGVLGICVVPDINSIALDYYVATAYEKETPLPIWSKLLCRTVLMRCLSVKARYHFPYKI